MPQNLTCDKIWKINVNFQEIEFQYEDSCIVMDQFEGNETKFCLVIYYILTRNQALRAWFQNSRYGG